MLEKEKAFFRRWYLLPFMLRRFHFVRGQNPDAVQISHDIQLVANSPNIVRHARQDYQIINTPDLPASRHYHLLVIDSELRKGNRG